MLNKDLDKIVIIDMNNGFVNEGALSSPNVKALVPLMEKFIKDNVEKGIEIVHYIDFHDENCKEFEVYPPHCIKNTWESEVIEELDHKEIRKVYKNSTNGFLVENPFDSKKNVYIIGCVTDICIFEFAMTSVKYLQENNLSFDIYVIDNLTATFDAPNHNAKKVHQEYLDKLKLQGVKIISI